MKRITRIYQRCSGVFLAIVVLGKLVGCSLEAAENKLTLPQGARIVLLGNTLAERMQYFGHFETLLQHQFPTQELTVRNLGWSADQLQFGWARGNEQELFRSKDFADHGHKLSDHQPDVIVACFGFNEAFAGEAGLESFRTQLRGFLKYVTETKFNGSTTPQVVLVTPIPHENLHRRELDDGHKNNVRIELYADAILAEAARAKVHAVDVFRPLLIAMEPPETNLTINGIHLNSQGDAALAEVLHGALFGTKPPHWPSLEVLRSAVAEKNQQFFYDYRAVNGFYIYGGRKAPFGIVNFPEEFAKLRKMIRRRDERIWASAQGKPVSDLVDDSGTGVLSPIETNFPRETRYLRPEEQQATFHLPRGFVAELYASEREFPDLANPCQFAVDGQGRLWICTMPTYPMYQPGVPVHDKIIVLEDHDKDGRADRQTVFADGLHLPTGIELGDGGAYVAQQPNLVFLKDHDGDGRADERQELLHGFDSADSHHSISTFTWGPGGELYFQEGTFHHSQVETPYGPVRVKDAAVFRWEPKSFKLDVFVSYPFANPWGHCFDRWGQNFVADASTGFNYFAAAFSGQVEFPQKHRRMETFLVKQWRPTAGCTLVSSPNFPAEMQGDFLITNCIGFQGVLQYRMSESGSGFKAEPVEPLLSSTDPAFRPVDVKFGPDGAVYVCDWYNPLVGHMQHNLRDPKRDRAHGRIWRIRYEGNSLAEPPQVEGASTESLVNLLAAADDQHRYAARRELRTHPTDKVLVGLQNWLSSRLVGDPQFEHDRLEVLWVQQHHDAVDPDLLEQVLTSPEPKARAAAVRVLCYWRDRVDNSLEKLVRAAQDEHPRVRLEAVRAASFLAGHAGEQVLQAALTKPLDYYLQYAINETAATLELRGGRPGGAAAAAAERLASGAVDDSQVLPLVKLSASQADASGLARLFASVMSQANFSDATKLAVVELLKVEATTRKLSPTIRPDVLVDHVARESAQGRNELAAAILGLVESWQIPGLVVELQRLGLASSSSPEVAQAALSALAADPSPSAGDAMREISTRVTDPQVQIRAALALARRSPQKAADLMIKAVSSRLISFETLAEVTEQILRQKAGASEMQKAFANTKLGKDAARTLLRAVYAAGTPEADLLKILGEAAEIDAKPAQLTPEQMQDLVHRIDKQGNAQAGELVFRRAELSCVKCHALLGAGGKIGPELSGIGATTPIDYLVDSILHPSKQIKEAYITHRILTGDGQVINGLRIDANDQRVVLRDADGKEYTIARDNIEEEFAGPSLMPEGLQNFMTEQDLLDLVKFLSVLGKSGEYAVLNAPLLRRFEVLTDEAVRGKLGAAEEGKLEGMLAEIPREAWQTRLTLFSGRLPVSQLVADASSPLVLRSEVQVTVAGALGIQVTPLESVQVVVNGRSISPSGKQEIELNPGRHAIFLVFEHGLPGDSLQVEVVRPEQGGAQFTVNPGD